MKTELLGVDPESLIERSTRRERRSRARDGRGRPLRTGSTFAISVTGEAGPKSATGVPPGTIFVGFGGPDGLTEVKRAHLPGDRNRVRTMAAQTALDFLRKKLS